MALIGFPSSVILTLGPQFNGSPTYHGLTPGPISLSKVSGQDLWTEDGTNVANIGTNRIRYRPYQTGPYGWPRLSAARLGGSWQTDNQDIFFDLNPAGTLSYFFRQYVGTNYTFLEAFSVSATVHFHSGGGGGLTYMGTWIGSIVSGCTPVAITSNPRSKSVDAGGIASFSVNVSGDAPFVYQWRKNGVAIAGATSATYTISSADSSHEGSYTCYVTNCSGGSNATSSAATLTVTPNDGVDGGSPRDTVGMPQANSQAVAGGLERFWRGQGTV